jgi:putative hemolysin
VELAGFALLLILSGFFSASEIAIYRANWIRLAHWVERHRAGARLGLRLLSWREPAVIAILVGNNLVNVFASLLAVRFVAVTFGPAYAGIAVVAVVILTVLFGEYLPKAIAQAHPNHWLAITAWPLAAVLVLCAPVVLLFSAFTRLIAAPPARPGRKLALTRQDFLAAMRRRERHACATPETDCRPGQTSSSIAARLLRFAGMRIGDAAIPVERVQSVPEHAGLEEVRAVVERHGFSRIPVRGRDPDDLVGVVVSKELLASDSYRVHPIEKFGGSSRALEVLETMQRRGQHIAAVTDEHGRVTGIVTLEDILEELVGEIRSEG